jgi:hypothetical protein
VLEVPIHQDVGLDHLHHAAKVIKDLNLALPN